MSETKQVDALCWGEEIIREETVLDIPLTSRPFLYVFDGTGRAWMLQREVWSNWVETRRRSWHATELAIVLLLAFRTRPREILFFFSTYPEPLEAGKK